MTVLQLTQGVEADVVASPIVPESTAVDKHTIVIFVEMGLISTPFTVGDGTTSVDADKRLLRAAAAVAQPDRPHSSAVSSTRALRLCAGRDQVCSDLGARSLRRGDVDVPLHQAQAAAGTAVEALWTAAWLRRVACEDKSV